MLKRLATLCGAVAMLALCAVSTAVPAKAEPLLMAQGVNGGVLGWNLVEAGFMFAGYEAMYKADGLTAGERVCRNGWHGIGFLVPDSCVNGHSAGLQTPVRGYNASLVNGGYFRPGPY